MMSRITEYCPSLRGNLLVLVFSLMIWKFMLQMVSPYESVYVFAIGGSGVTLGILSTVQMFDLNSSQEVYTEPKSMTYTIAYALIMRHELHAGDLLPDAPPHRFLTGSRVTNKVILLP